MQAAEERGISTDGTADAIHGVSDKIKQAVGIEPAGGKDANARPSRAQRRAIG